MLYDKRWERPKVKPLSRAGLIAWLMQQPREGTYNWRAPTTCMAAQYLEAIGMARRWHKLERIFGDHQEYLRISGEKPWTFGAALERAKD
jgi:hypothetical protein